MKLPIGEQLTRTYIILYVRFCKSGGGSRNPVGALRNFVFDSDVRLLDVRWIDCEAASKRRRVRGISIYVTNPSIFSSFPFTNVRPLFPSSNAGQKSSSSVRCRNFDSAPCTRKKGDRMGDIFPGSWVMQHTSTARSQYISGMHGAFHDKIFQYWHPVSIYRAAREIRRAVGTYLYEFHFGWLYSALLPQRSPAKRPKRGGTHFDVHVLRFR